MHFADKCLFLPENQCCNHSSKRLEFQVLFCMVGKAAIIIIQVLIFGFCCSGFGFSLCRCNEVASARELGERENEGQVLL